MKWEQHVLVDDFESHEPGGLNRVLTKLTKQMFAMEKSQDGRVDIDKIEYYVGAPSPNTYDPAISNIKVGIKFFLNLNR